MRFRGCGVGHRSTVACNAVLRREVPAASSVQRETEGEGETVEGDGTGYDQLAVVMAHSGEAAGSDEEEGSGYEEEEEIDEAAQGDSSDDDFDDIGSEEDCRDEDDYCRMAGSRHFKHGALNRFFFDLHIILIW